MNRHATAHMGHAERFWHYVSRRCGDGCWTWCGSTVTNGYGQVRFMGRYRLAHIVSLLLCGRVPAAGQECCHKCDNRRCVRPDHIVFGTRQFNMSDAESKRRMFHRGNTKLTDAQVAEARALRAEGHTYREIGERFGVHLSTVAAIVYGKNWASR